jgi:phage terminase small subunit
VQHDQAVREMREHGAVVNGKVSPWITVQEKAQRAMVALSMRLRLSPQARREKAQLPRHPVWWETRGRQEHE